TRIRALFVDCDGAPMPKVWHVRPSFVTRRDASHWHAYWVLSDDIPLPEFDVAQRRLAAHYGTDPKVHDLPRVMRLAGTLHQKDPSRPLLVTIGADKPRRTYPAAEVLDGLPEPAPKMRTTGKGAGVPTGEPVSAEIVRAMLAVLD